MIREARERGLSVGCLDVGIPRRSFKKEAGKYHAGSPWVCLEHFVTYGLLMRALGQGARRALSDGDSDGEYLGAFHQTGNSFREAFALSVATRVVDAVEPRSIFTGAESLFVHRALSRRAKQRGIPVFALQHGDVFLRPSGRKPDGAEHSRLHVRLLPRSEESARRGQYLCGRCSDGYR